VKSVDVSKAVSPTVRSLSGPPVWSTHLEVCDADTTAAWAEGGRRGLVYEERATVTRHPFLLTTAVVAA
jgi:hypothetical protein